MTTLSPKFKLIALLSISAFWLSACKTTPEYSNPSEAQAAQASEIAQQLAEKYITPEHLLTDIKILSSDRFGGRAPFSAGEKLTVDYIEQKFIANGLQPMFGDSYRQAVPLVSITLDPTTVKTTITQDNQRRDLKYGSEIMLGTSRVVESIDVAESQVVFVGYGIVAPEYEWDDYKNLDVKGKIVLILVNDPGFVEQDPEFFKGKAMTYYGRWTYKYEEAARQGASGAVIIHETAPASYPWKVVSSSWSGPQFVLDSANGNMHRLPFEAWVPYAIADQWVTASGMNLENLKKEALSSNFESIPLDIHLSVHLDNTLEKAKSYNVGAVLPGSENPDELFFYMGHWDHLGIDESSEHGADNIFNGAVDNASGIAGVLALANTFSRLPQTPARSIGFLAVAAEESGLLGSAYYTANPPFPMNKTIGGINMDAMNVYGSTEDIIVVGYGSSSLEDTLKGNATLQKRTVEAEPFPEKGYFYRSDHFNFAKRGVPVLYAKGGVKHRAEGEQYMRDLYADYTSNRYHAPADEITESWDLNGLADDLKLFFNIGLQLGNSNSWPHWYAGNEFKAIREASMSNK
ncbi:MAG: M28 family metallopeptidase [Xanthomonadales bacterium]|nr:M28 family metallopeptidase [Xanthomonadales bacterium]